MIIDPEIEEQALLVATSVAIDKIGPVVAEVADNIERIGELECARMYLRQSLPEVEKLAVGCVAALIVLARMELERRER